MFIKITKKVYKGKTLEHAKIVESYRDGTTTRQKVVLNLGPVRTEDDKEKFNRILAAMKEEGGEFVPLNAITAQSCREFGVAHAATSLLDRYGVSDVLKSELSKNRADFDVYGVVKGLIINRLTDPSSDLSACDWIRNDYYSHDQLFDVQEHHVYRASDHLIGRKDEIEQGVFNALKKKLKLNTDFVHYDLTSTYFEGSCCVIAAYGYSRDHRKDRKQVVVGLVMVDGVPIHHEVFTGNTVDKATLERAVNDLKKRFNLDRVVFVADRGLITEKNLGFLESENYQYVLGVQRRNNNTLAKELLTKKLWVWGRSRQRRQQYAKEVRRVKVDGKTHPQQERRYILCLDENTRKERLETLEAIRENTEKKLKDLRKKSKKARTGGRRRDKLMTKAHETLGKNARLFRVWWSGDDDDGSDGGLKFSLDKEHYDYEKQIAGRFLLVTNNTSLSPDDVVKTYKELQTVENAFDEIKNFLDVRPIYHHTETRVKAHVFICVLAFLVECIIERLTKKQSARKTLRKLRRVKIVKLGVGNGNGTKTLITELPEETARIFDRLGIRKPGTAILMRQQQ